MAFSEAISTFKHERSDNPQSRSRPLVTVGLCIRNCQDTIVETLDSILAQDFPPALLEAILVDDGSEDSTLSIVQECVSKMDFDSRVFSSRWMGLGLARQIVVDNAQGKYVVWVDGDMTLSKGFIRKQVDFMEKNPSVGIAKGKCGFSPNESLVGFLENVPFVVFHNQQEGRILKKLLGTGGAIYRIESIKDAGGFDLRIKGAAEDVDLEHRIRNAGWTVCVSRAIFYEKRPRTWKNLWSKYIWYGYGMHYALHKAREIERLYEMSPPAALLEGFFCSVSAYKLIPRKTVFLLPLHFLFKMTAWSLGYIQSHASSYGHLNT